MVGMGDDVTTSACCRCGTLYERFRRQHGRCYWCGRKVGDTWDADHVVALSRGGANHISNIVIACPTCNRSKQAKLPHEFSDRLC